MRRLVSTLALTAFATVLALGSTPALADRDHDHDRGANHRRCPRGSHWVPAHRDRMGRWIPAHCKAR